MIFIGSIVAGAVLFTAYGLLAWRCDCHGPRCAGCPHVESHDET